MHLQERHAETHQLSAQLTTQEDIAAAVKCNLELTGGKTGLQTASPLFHFAALAVVQGQRVNSLRSSLLCASSVIAPMCAGETAHAACFGSGTRVGK